MKRDDLVKICIDSVVPHFNWSDKESYLAQLSIKSIYKGLTAGLSFKIKSKDKSKIVIEFLKPVDLMLLSRLGIELKVSTRDEYFRDCDPKIKTEMLNGIGINFHSNNTEGYMPTSSRLKEVGGNTWH